MVHEIDLSRIDLNLLVLFEAVFAEAHVGRAAARLNLSTSAVSHGLGRLRRVLHDPLFLKTPKGVVPTERAAALAPAIAEALRQVRTIVSDAQPFDPATSTRRMMIGAPDGASIVFLHSLLARIQSEAPGIGIGIRQLMPLADEMEPQRAWRGAFTELEARSLDVAIIPASESPLRFERRELYDEDFVLIMRPDHRFRGDRSLETYCRSRHLVVSHSGDPQGFVDQLLSREGLYRRVALTVPSFLFACHVVGETDLICAVPRRFAAGQAARLAIAIEEPPISLGRFSLNAFVPKAALSDAGLAWLLDRLSEASSDLGRAG